MLEVRIKENSWLAKIAARKLKCDCVAMVFGKTIHLYNSTREEFLKNQYWVRHEIAHVKQYKQLGVLKFLLFYLIETVKNGYEKNRFEIDARQKESDVSILSEVHFH